MRRTGFTIPLLALGSWLLGLTAAIWVLDRAAIQRLEPVLGEWAALHAEHAAGCATYTATAKRLDLLSQAGQPPASLHLTEQHAWLVRVERQAATLRADLQAGLLELDHVLNQQGRHLNDLRQRIDNATGPILFFRQRFAQMVDLPPPSIWTDRQRGWTALDQ